MTTRKCCRFGTGVSGRAILTCLWVGTACASMQALAASKKPAQPNAAWEPTYSYKSGGDITRLTLKPNGPGRYVANLSVTRSDGCSGTIEKALAAAKASTLVIAHPDDKACQVTVTRAGARGADLRESPACSNWHGMSCSFADVPLKAGR